MTTPLGRRATIADVAGRAGVSRTTVSHALAGKGRVDPETRRRVLEAASELRYWPSPRAQRLRGGRANAIALLTALPASIVGDESEMGFLIEMAMPMARACLAHGYSLLLVPPEADRRHLESLDVDGAIVLDPLRDDASCAAFAARGVRVVTVGTSPGVHADAAIERGLAGADVMIEHLAGRGARRVAVVVTEESYRMTTLMEEFSSSSRAGALVDVLHAAAAGGEESARIVVARHLQEHPDVDAVYAPLDAFAIGGARAARALGRRIGVDLLVATNYDGPRSLRSDPPLTALDLALPDMAARAAGLLFSVLDGTAAGVIEAPMPRVIARGSTAGRLE